jgi:phosphoribosylglycinamide formyltransferase-1
VPAVQKPPSRLVVLISGAGTNLQALLDASRDPSYGADVVAVVTDRTDVNASVGLRRAEAAGVAVQVVQPAEYPDRASWDAALTEAVAAHRPDLVVSAGFMRLLGRAFLSRFAVVNTHPALLPSFPGAHAVRDALAYGVRVSGATVHLVDQGVDTGPIVAQVAVPVCDDDDEQSLHERIKFEERRMLVDVVGRMARGGWSVTDRRVSIP